MDRNQNCPQRETCPAPRSRRQRTLLCQRARRILELPLDYVPNPQFQVWARHKEAENEMLGPLPEGGRPTGGGVPDKVPAPAGLAPYMASLYDVPLLTRAQELHLFRKLNYLKYKMGRLRTRLDPARPQEKLLARLEDLCQETVAVRNRLICANLRLVVSIAKRYLGPGQNFFELVSDGNVSLMRAVERFDYSLGNRFSTYATWAIINNFARTVSEGRRHRDRFHTASFQLFATAAEVPPNHREREAARSRRKSALDGILGRLDEREREIIVCRFGLRGGDQPQTLQQVGDVLGVSKERIRQIEARGVTKLRKAGPPPRAVESATLEVAVPAAT